MSTIRKKKKAFGGLSKGRSQQKLRTRRHILEAASGLIASGQIPTVADAADAASVSRRTAYRYFPTQAKLLTEAALEGLRPSMDTVFAELPTTGASTDVESRLRVVVGKMQKLAVRNESLLRTMIHQTVLERAPAGQPRRGTRRIDWLESAVAPLREKLSLRVFNRLVSALALSAGIEALMVLRDICGLSEEEAANVSEWAAAAMLRQALSEGSDSLD
jgi:AcrR family transcriptional regulator